MALFHMAGEEGGTPHPSFPVTRITKPPFPQNKSYFGLLFDINHYLYAIFIISLHHLVNIEWLEDGIN